jgi:hypothetical protein
MTIHLVKLCVGADDVADLARWQQTVMARRAKAGLDPVPVHETRNTPKQASELTDGGSLYWVIKGVIRVRQAIVGVATVSDGTRPYCVIRLNPELVRTDPQPKPAFQGWRYLKPADAPRDLSDSLKGVDVPSDLAQALKDAMVW